jgi:hypothetical protein
LATESVWVEKCSIRFLRVSSGRRSRLVHGESPKMPASRSGLAASSCRRAVWMAMPTFFGVWRTSFQCAPFGNLEAVILGELGIGEIAIGVGQGGLVFLVPDIGDALEEQQREDELLVVAGVDQAAQQDGGTPEVGFEFLLGDP